MIGILKVLVDGVWYLALLAPIIAAVPDVAGKILTAVPVIWAVYVAICWKRRDFVSDLQDMILFEAKVLLPVGLLELLFLGPTAWQRQCGGYALAFLVLGIFLLRVSRIAQVGQGKGRFFGTNGLYLLVTLGIAAVLASETVRNGAVWLIKNAYERCVIPILWGLIWLAAHLISAIVSFLSGLFSQAEVTNNQEALQLNTDFGLDAENADIVQTPLFLQILGYGIVILIAILLLYFVYRRLAGEAGARSRKVTGSLTRSRDEKAADGSGNRGLFGGERNVRYYYRRFLACCVEEGLDMDRPLTSEDVHSLASLYWDETQSEELRDLYRKVRYGGFPEQKEEKKRAKDLFQSFRETLTRERKRVKP